MDEYRNILKEVDRLCQSRTIPMSSSLVEEVKNVYKKGLSLEIRSKVTPLMLASDWRYDDLVWGFIQCAKQTNTNLQTGGTLDLQEFLGYTNSSGQTALHVAAKQGSAAYHVIRVLLKEVSVEHLISYRDESGNTPISLLEQDDWYDEQIFEVMEAAAASKGDHQVVDPTTTHDKQQGFVPVYTEIEMDPNSRPTSHINETRESLKKLDGGVLELTENKSTILHLVSELGDTAYAKDILKRHPSLVHNRNTEGETPLYVAAREGHIDMLEIYAKSDKIEQLATRSTDKDTALHIAIQKHHVGVVFWLVKRIPQLANHVNDLNESPLYLAAYKNSYAIVELIVKECKEKAYDGPDRKTALHAAVISAVYRGRRERCIRSLIQANIGLLKIQDKDGWTPLHYAAKLGPSYMIRELLEKRSRYFGRQMTTTEAADDIIITSAFGITDTNGRNMLHVAIEYKELEIIELIFGDESLIISLINQKDSNGDTPLHLLMASSDLPMNEIMMDAGFDIDVRNNENCTPLQSASSDEKREILKEAMAKLVGKRGKARRRLWGDLEKEIKRKKRKQVFSRIGDNVVLVVTLIATATFAAAFTVPGGFDGNQGPDQGMPILLRKAAYKAFVVANALAFSCSCTVLFGHIRLQLDEAGEEEKDGSINIISLQYLLTGIAMVSMAIAFVTGTYVILTPSLGFAIPVCAMCLCIMVPLSIFPRKRLGFATAILRKLT